MDTPVGGAPEKGRHGQSGLSATECRRQRLGLWSRGAICIATALGERTEHGAQASKSLQESGLSDIHGECGVVGVVGRGCTTGSIEVQLLGALSQLGAPARHRHRTVAEPTLTRHKGSHVIPRHMLPASVSCKPQSVPRRHTYLDRAMRERFWEVTPRERDRVCG